ncbi:hypothetical protein [Streptomyces griseocarneus]|uniref:hypothetical protein n=1 Tax=Streptomyces griseocarneus TaxID=51201 RepID=UPI00167EA4D6|nr:hypothetical protein [Streptomyces griseocarneus]MBZ6473212.1 hypothetical protein [Streptomyces griseocarneus]GHG60474.1 hypothetical protein GCM10018779_27820 [Streptomyces griseocarneus]
MRTYVGHQEAVNDEDFEELAFGFEEDFRELFLGLPGESAEDRVARVSAARDVLAELWEESGADEIALLNALYAAQLEVAVVRSECAALLTTSAGMVA